MSQSSVPRPFLSLGQSDSHVEAETNLAEYIQMTKMVAKYIDAYVLTRLDLSVMIQGRTNEGPPDLRYATEYGVVDWKGDEEEMRIPSSRKSPGTP